MSIFVCVPAGYRRVPTLPRRYYRAGGAMLRLRRNPRLGERTLTIGVGGPDEMRIRIDRHVLCGGGRRKLADQSQAASCGLSHGHPIGTGAVDKPVGRIEGDLVNL